VNVTALMKSCLDASRSTLEDSSTQWNSSNVTAHARRCQFPGRYEGIVGFRADTSMAAAARSALPQHRLLEIFWFVERYDHQQPKVQQRSIDLILEAIFL
jgi:hypothetical protein